MPEDVRLISPFADAVFSTDKEYMMQTLAVNVMKKVAQRFKGDVGRFSQVQLGNNNISDGAVSNYQLIGTASGGWETINFTKDLRADIVAINNFQPVIGVNSGTFDADLLKKQIRINSVALFEALASLARFTKTPPTDGNGFCDYPLASGLQVELTPEMWGPATTNGEVLIPMSPLIGVPQIISGNCPNTP